jgi:histidine triad (HIT) family protein
MNEDCVFCKIIRNELPAEKVYENDKIISFLNLRPSSRGHVLIVHKTHTPDFQSTPDEILCELMPHVKNIASAVMKSTGATGYNLSVNNGSAAGQVIFHLHFHLVPRYSGDGLKLFPEINSDLSARQALALEIKKNLT